MLVIVVVAIAIYHITITQITVGELKRWWGYALAISIHKGVPMEKMWSDTPLPESILPPPRMGRHGMTKERFKKIRSVLAFGPHDEASLRADNWAFIRTLINMFNECRCKVVVRAIYLILI